MKNRYRFGVPPEHRENRRPTWREYQARLGSHRRRHPRRYVVLGGVLGVGLLAALMGFYGFVGAIGTSSTTAKNDSDQSAMGPAPSPLLDKTDVQDLLAAEPVSQLTRDRFPVRFGDRRLIVETTIDSGLQQQLTTGFDKRHSRYIAIVVMDAANGDILALAGFDRTGSDLNPCIDKRFPAASIFKIVTAAAAVETHGMTAGTPLVYNGAKHTLYKSQLKDSRNRYTRQTTLKDSFAQSVNPVFGKLGVITLGQENLKRFGEAFGFNRQIRFEKPISPSELTVEDDPYSWAEIASGFNQSTQISPLHGALMAASLVNDGAMMEPTIVRRIVDESGSILYQNQALEMNRPVSDKTSAVIRRLMAETVRKGTARKSFNGYRKDKILSRLNIGGKTGSIDNRTHDVRLDWFVGYAEYSGDKIALAAVVAHEDYIGKRAAAYAKTAMSAYFQSKVDS